MSVTNSSIATASRKSRQSEYGYQQRQADPGPHADTPPQARLAGVRTIARLSQFHKRHPYRLSAGVSEMR
jgi:hypothetical protein